MTPTPPCPPAAPVFDWGPSVDRNLSHYVRPLQNTTLLQPRGHTADECRPLLLIVVMSAIRSFEVGHRHRGRAPGRREGVRSPGGRGGVRSPGGEGGKGSIDLFSARCAGNVNPGSGGEVME